MQIVREVVQRTPSLQGYPSSGPERQHVEIQWKLEVPVSLTEGE